MRIAILGDSPAGRIKRTRDRTIKGSASWNISWFISRSMRTHPLRIRIAHGRTVQFDNFLLVTDRPFDYEDYDAVIGIGMGADIRQGMLLSYQFSHPGVGPTANRRLTAVTWKSALHNVYKSTQAMQIVSAVRQADAEQVILYAPPVHPGSWIDSRPGHVKDWSTNLQGQGYPHALSLIFHQALRDTCGTREALYMPQPSQSVEAFCWTRPEYGFAKYQDATNIYIGPRGIIFIKKSLCRALYG